ncbi:Heavy metal RND efflux outer membrane protein, CzcC family [Pseudomonas sp. R2-37-08W]|nr:Heavy metal RND efflux outer membrane protein, CzcC family [Pseudomonas sp. R2-37-08W]
MLAKNPRAPHSFWCPALSLTTFASKLAPTGGGDLWAFASAPVGASLLAKSPRAPHSFWCPALSLTAFASKLAPTGGGDL